MCSTLIWWVSLSIKLIISLYRQIERYLQGFGFARRSLVNAIFSGYNLHGCYFSEANLQQSNFEGVIGGFSPVRPIVLVATATFSIWLISSLSPLPNILLSKLLQLPETLELLLSTLLAITLLLKFILIGLYARYLPKQIVELGGKQYLTNKKIDNKASFQIKLSLTTNRKLPASRYVLSEIRVSFRQHLTEIMQIILAILPAYLEFTCYGLMTGIFIVKSLTEPLLLFIVAIFLKVAALSIFIFIIGRFFLCHTSFVQADLTNANLNRTNFSGCNFFKAKLHSASLQGADLSNCNLSKANLRFADLRGANLQGANLKYALIEEALGLTEALHAK